MGVTTQLSTIYKITTTPLAHCSNGRKFRKFGWEVELMKACDTAAQGPYATNVNVLMKSSPCHPLRALFVLSGVLQNSGGVTPLTVSALSLSLSLLDPATYC